MQILTRIFIAILLVLLGIFAINNLQPVQITFPGVQLIQVSLAAAAVLFFVLGFIAACAWLSIGMIRRYFVIRGLKKRIQDLETRLPVVEPIPAADNTTTDNTFEKKLY